MKVRLATSIVLQYQADERSTMILNVQAARTPSQLVLEEKVSIDGEQSIAHHEDAMGNRMIRLLAGPGTVRVRCDSLVEIRPHLADPASLAEVAPWALPAQALPYVLPSRYCESDRLLPFAMVQFGSLPMGYRRFEAIAHWVRDNVLFLPGASQWSTSAWNTFHQRQGVCRDFAHLTIALCRALNIPARFVTGIDHGADPALGPLDFHAYVEAFVGDRWYLLDPSGISPTTGLIRIGTGRDAAEASFATLFGNVTGSAPVIECDAIVDPLADLHAPTHSPLAVSTASLERTGESDRSCAHLSKSLKGKPHRDRAIELSGSDLYVSLA